MFCLFKQQCTSTVATLVNDKPVKVGGLFGNVWLALEETLNFRWVQTDVSYHIKLDSNSCVYFFLFSLINRRSEGVLEAPTLSNFYVN
jgi:hypothetical protein